MSNQWIRDGFSWYTETPFNNETGAMPCFLVKDRKIEFYKNKFDFDKSKKPDLEIDYDKNDIEGTSLVNDTIKHITAEQESGRIRTVKEFGKYHGTAHEYKQIIEECQSQIANGVSNYIGSRIKQQKEKKKEDPDQVQPAKKQKRRAQEKKNNKAASPEPGRKPSGNFERQLETAKKMGYVQGVCECVAAIVDNRTENHALGKKLLTEMKVTKGMAEKYAKPETLEILQKNYFFLTPLQEQKQSLEQARPGGQKR